ncbi:hypothetical protein TVAG_183630 [Trichomonas vaginalis G3]|uniref:Uncharacterized protein n=1 Tax=Trichomonas vaginalis (strain ATCC PRA-98 / G3) TaxID=412133 RepID=A2D9A0_TRIV3|nr:hypothetical protein TVAGG3_0770900 [Trichomonas vaginalis G3]EAY23126.1 hypothetical protein TVAG_183630 [Trichomonas vaginalis G3]KAI5513822.1 hypothetical protein TVAGG3_0770900 [Trichomonas vaginalis G3]|eukprot:XP_001584112.1 hypothetical protein [Trichomonas vaginalis G3]
MLPGLMPEDDFLKRMQAVNDMKQKIDSKYKNLSTKAAISKNKATKISCGHRKPSLQSQYHVEPKQKPYQLLKKPPRQSRSKVSEPALIVIKKYIINSSQGDMSSALRPKLGSISTRSSPLLSSAPNFPSPLHSFN